ncbi:MAG: hypothetical protein U1E50_16655 [Caulobacteraceae bacterium]
MRALILAALLVLAPAAALAAPATPVPPAASSVQREQALIERLTIERANALAANDARWSAQYADRARRLEAAEKALRAAQSTSAAELARLTAEKKALADEIAAKDQAYAQEIAAYRELMSGVVAQAGPEKLAALERYAAGDRIGAFPVLQQITEAENAARDRAAAALDQARRRANAANMRALGAQALDMLQRGELTADKAEAIFVQVCDLDADDVWSLIQLGRLRFRLGRLESARTAFDAAMAKATDDDQRVSILAGQADIMLRVHDRAGAVAALQRMAALAEARSKADPADLILKANLVISLTRLSDVQMDAGQSAQARESITRALFMAIEIYKLQPDNSNAQLAASTGLNAGGKMHRVGNLAVAGQIYDMVLQVYDELQKTGLDQTDRTNICVLRLMRGALAADQDNLQGALEEYKMALVAAEALNASDPGDQYYRGLLDDTLDRLGGVYSEMGDWAKARDAYQRSLVIARAASEASPTDLDQRRNIAIGYDRIGAMLMQEGKYIEADAAFRQAEAILAPPLQSNPGGLQPRADNAHIAWRLGVTAKARSDLAAAVASLTRAVDLQLSIVRDQADNRTYQRDLVEYARDLAEAQAKAGDREGAAKNYRRSREAAAFVAGEEPSNPAAQRDLALTLFQIARDLGGDGTWARAAAQYERAAALGPLPAKDQANLVRAKREASR